MKASCYRRCLELAEERSLRSLSFPAISTGIYRYPMGEAAQIARAVVRGHLARDAGSLQEVTFVLFDQAAFDGFAGVLTGL